MYDMQEATSAQPDPPLVTRQLLVLDETLDALSAITHHLIERLSPVLRPEERVDGSDAIAAVDSPLCEVGDRLRRSARQAETIRNVLSEAIDKLEI